LQVAIYELQGAATSPGDRIASPFVS